MSYLLLLLSVGSLLFGSYRLALMSLKNRELTFIVFITLIYWIGSLELIMALLGYVVHDTSPRTLVSICIVTTLGVEWMFRKSKSSSTITKSLLRFSIPKPYILALLIVGFVTLLLQNLYVIFRMIFTPSNVLDTLTYHLPTLIQWQKLGYFPLHSINPVERIVYSAKGLKFLNFWYVAFMKGVGLVEITQYVGYIVLGAAAYTLLTLLRTSKELKIAGTLAILTLPLSTIELYTLQDHMYLTSLHLALLCVVILTVKEVFVPRMRWIPLIVTTILLANAKHSAPAHIAIIGLTSLWFWRGRFSLSSIRNHIKILSIGGFLISILGGWIYAVNVYYYSSPFGPKLPQIERQGKLLSNILDFPIRITDMQHKFVPDLVGISGFGPLFLGIVVPIVIINFNKIRKDNYLSLLTFSTIGTTLCYFVLYYTPYNYRLLQFIPTTLIIVALACIDTFALMKLKKVVLILCILFIPLTVGASLFGGYYKDPVRAYADSVLTNSNERSIARFDSDSDQFDHDNSFIVLDQYIPFDEPVAFISQSEVGYDDVITAAYQNNTLEREAIWLGDIQDSDLFDDDNRPTQALIEILKAKHIHLLHNNIVHYYNQSRVLDFSGTPFVRIADELWYLPY